MGTKEFWKFDPATEEVKLRPIPGKMLLLCLDGYNKSNDGTSVYCCIDKQLGVVDRLVVCSSMATLRKRNMADDALERIEFFRMNSWTQNEYLAAVSNEVFYSKVMDAFDANNVFDMNDNSDEVQMSDEEKEKKYALNRKYYYARFQYHKQDVMTALESAVKTVENKAELVYCCSRASHSDSINSFYGMHDDGDLGGGRFPVSS
ncbi:hypothetical protein AM587_10013450 [Phytophthora nicotianae]|uniref:Uncharacterized protein n=1 Tax=Phytophthora nicotianae TaxID=4792 RepID=A0A0W8BVW5_PHYNI|nr:hypothetical protein AM587_10013450 [Phytophthora nicotianae]